MSIIRHRRWIVNKKWFVVMFARAVLDESGLGVHQFWMPVTMATRFCMVVPNTGWGIKISNFSKGHCAGGCSGSRQVGVVSCGWLASTVVSNHIGLDR